MAERVSVQESDFLDQDPSIRGQNYVCLSFVSPEDVIVQKDAYFFNQYLQSFSTELKDLFDNLVQKFQKDQPDISDMFTNLASRYDALFSKTSLQEDFNIFKATNSEKLEAEYLSKNNYRTTIRGLKVRGTYETLVEAQKRAKAIKSFDDKFDVYVAEVGCWCPWSPNPTEIQNAEYAETELNTLVSKYKENLLSKEAYHKMRADELMKKVAAKNADRPILEEVSPPPDTTPAEQEELDGPPATQPPIDNILEALRVEETTLDAQSDPWLDSKQHRDEEEKKLKTA